MNSPKLELISFALCPFVARARAILIEKDFEHEVTYIDLKSPPDWFKEVSPLGKVPVLRVGGRPLFESQVICEYLDETTPGSLHPADAFARAENRAWIEFGSEILRTTHQFVSTKDDAEFDSLGESLGKMFNLLEVQLGEGPYFNGKEFCIIDAVYAPIFRWHGILSKYFDAGFFKATPKINQWRTALLERASVQASVLESYEADFEKFLHAKESVFSGKM